MQFVIDIQKPRWQPVVTIRQGTMLVKGRKNEWYRTVTEAAGQVSAPCGCYCWGTSNSIGYIGSFRPYVRGKFANSLQGRVQNYPHYHWRRRRNRPAVVNFPLKVGDSYEIPPTHVPGMATLRH
jgi:hypothetical protein